MLYKFNEFNEYKDRESTSRSKTLSEEEFLKTLNENCKNFSFESDLLWRNKGFSGDMSIFFEAERNGTIGTYNYKDFFDTRREYPVPRYKSLIGSTSIKGSEYLASHDGPKARHLVIPFDNTQIVFAPTPDMGILAKVNVEYTDDMFIMKEYVENFKVPYDFLKPKCEELIGSNIYSKVTDFGFEFFTNGNCLLLRADKIDWLKSIIN